MLALTGSIWLEIIRNSKAQGDYKHNFASLSVKKKVWAGKEIRGRLSILSVWPDPQVCIRWNHTPIRIPSEMSIRSIVLIFQVADLYCCLPQIWHFELFLFIREHALHASKCLSSVHMLLTCHKTDSHCCVPEEAAELDLLRSTKPTVTISHAIHHCGSQLSQVPPKPTVHLTTNKPFQTILKVTAYRYFLIK